MRWRYERARIRRFARDGGHVVGSFERLERQSVSHADGHDDRRGLRSRSDGAVRSEACGMCCRNRASDTLAIQEAPLPGLAILT